MNALILDGATGERMKPITNWIPKDLIKIDGISLLQRHIESLQETDQIKAIAVTIHQHKEKVLKVIKTIDKKNKPIITHIETKLEGTARATLKAWETLGKNEPLLVIYGDVYFNKMDNNHSNCFRWFCRLYSKYYFGSILGASECIEPWTDVMTVKFDREAHLHHVTKFEKYTGKLNFAPIKEPIMRGSLDGGVYVIQDRNWTLWSHVGLLVLDPEVFPLLRQICHGKTKSKVQLGKHFLPVAVKKHTFNIGELGGHQDMKTIEQYCDLQQKIYNEKLKHRITPNLAPIFKALLETEDIIWLIGNGGSLTVAQHAALDLTKASGKKAICLSDPGVITAYTNDLTFEMVFKNYLEKFITIQDILISLSASGESKDILEAVEYCNKSNIITIGITSKGSTLAKISKLAIEFDEKDPKVLEDLFSITMHKLTRMLEDVR